MGRITLFFLGSGARARQPSYASSRACCIIPPRSLLGCVAHVVTVTTDLRQAERPARHGLTKLNTRCAEQFLLRFARSTKFRSVAPRVHRAGVQHRGGEVLLIYGQRPRCARPCELYGSRPANVSQVIRGLEYLCPGRSRSSSGNDLQTIRPMGRYFDRACDEASFDSY